MITAEHIISLLELQKATNVAYFGDNWDKHWTEVACANSIYREWAEFLDEVSSSWKIYGNDQCWHKVDAVYELVDVVHFMLCAVLQLKNKSVDEEELYMADGFPIPRAEFSSLGLVTKMFTDFMHDPSSFHLGQFLAYSCSFLGLDAETYMLAHKRKNDRNRLRAAGGADYDKSNEQPLTLEF